MTTKAQEREILAKIEKLIKDAGPDSYIAYAFDGCCEMAKSNIDNDFADSMKDAAQHNADKALAAEKRAAEAEQRAEALQLRLDRMTEKMLTGEELRDLHETIERAASNTARRIAEDEKKIVETADNPNSPEFQSAVTDHRTATKRLEKLRKLSDRVTAAMQ